MSSFVQLADRAAMQGGLITTAQAERLGTTRLQLSRYERSDKLDRIAQGVYRVPGAAPNPHEHIMAAWMSIERAAFLDECADAPHRGVVVGGAAAAALHEAGDLYVDDVDLITPTPRRTSREGIRTRTRSLERNDVVIATGVPSLSVTATIADLVQQRVPLDHVAQVVRDGVDRIDVARLDALLQPLAPRNDFADGRAFRVRLFELAGRDPESVAAVAAHSALAPLIAQHILKDLDIPSLFAVEQWDALRPANITAPILAHLARLAEPITRSWTQSIDLGWLQQAAISPALVDLAADFARVDIPGLNTFVSQMTPVMESNAAIEAAGPVEGLEGSETGVADQPDEASDDTSQDGAES